MRIAVMIKQVPGTSNVEVDEKTGVLKRDGVESKLNPYDLFAIEQAVAIKEETGCIVTAVTMGPMQAKAAVAETLCMGVDDGLILSDRAFAGADVLATSYTLSQGLRRLGKVELYICGKQTTDGDTAQVGPETAEFLGIPHVTNVISIDNLDEESVTLTFNEDSVIQTARIAFPLLITMEKDCNTPRLPSFKRRLELEHSGELEQLISVISLADFEDNDKKHYGLSGSPTQVERIFPPDRRQDRKSFSGTPDELCSAIFGVLSEKKFV